MQVGSYLRITYRSSYLLYGRPKPELQQRRGKFRGSSEGGGLTAGGCMWKGPKFEKEFTREMRLWEWKNVRVAGDEWGVGFDCTTYASGREGRVYQIEKSE